MAYCSPAAAVSETVAGDPPTPQFALRTDHMALDAALHDASVLMAVQSRRVEVLAFVQQGSRLISSGNDAQVRVWEVPARPEGSSP